MTPLVSLEQVSDIGTNLVRPESVHVASDGTLSVSHRGRGISVISPDGRQAIVGREGNDANGHELIPNGISRQSDGSFLLANIGDGGGVWRLTADGELKPFLMEVDGQFLAAANFVTTDEQGRVWITVSTISQPRFDAYSDKVADGLIIVVDEAGARIVADDICFANECRVSPDGNSLVISETFSRRVTQFDLAADGSLSNRHTLAQFDRGDFPDGCRYDSKGYLWLTSIVVNRVWRIAPDGTRQLILEDSDPAHIEWVESALAKGEMGREHFYQTGNTRFGNVASINFTPDESHGLLGSLCGTAIHKFPIADIIKGET
ncbi:SMP-30/gluconolactonase/LRE family protein [Ahrensia sp. AH-315-G08]|nr:SMP-30/gluconolactonase/LRE family protein [Ahrensia sp. AH-315-G08]